LGVFDVIDSGLKIDEIAPGVTRDEIAAKTEANLAA
jgi:acyl CoA:acetate/3-ketoacid CoA transferase beta subunit